MTRLVLFLIVGAGIYLWLQEPARRRRVIERWLLPGLAVVLALLYLRSPIDLIPDVSPVAFLDDLMMLIGAIWWARRRMRQPQAQPRRDPQPEHRDDAERRVWDPYEVLGVRRGAAQMEIARAYRQRMKEYHPDRVNDLGEELRQVAHNKTLDIQRAYEELSRSPGGEG